MHGKYVIYSYLYYDCALNIYDMKYGDLQYCKVGKMMQNANMIMSYHQEVEE